MYFVYGLKKSGISIIKLFQKKNKEFKIWDDDLSTRKNFKKKFDNKYFLKPNVNSLKKFDKIFVSPGITLNQKKFKTSKITSKLNRDLNLYISNIKQKNIIAITGTNGKSTTTKLIGDVLKKNKINTFVGGNIGEPLCNSIISKKNYDLHVIELSSFQLETVSEFQSKISIITNIASDHLDRYKNINEYVNQKKNIITKKGINLISIDDKHSKKIFLDKEIKNKISFSIHNKDADFYMKDQYIIDNYFKKNKKLYIKNISKDLEGHFNSQNILITYICSKILKLPEKNFIQVIKKFKGLPFRSKIIYDNKKFKIINNSKSTNLHSTINSIQNYNNIYLILGGIAKEKNFEILSNYSKKILCVYTFGSSAIFIKNKLKKEFDVKIFKNLKLLINEVFKDIKNNKNKGIILFAPACSSFDQYKNFEDRGSDFSKLIKERVSNL